MVTRNNGQVNCTQKKGVRMSEPGNILLIQLGDIGDVVLTTPTIRAIRENFKEARITILVRKPFCSLLLADPNLHEVIETEKIRGSLFQILTGYIRFIRRLRQARYDLVIDLRTGDRGAILTFCTGAKMRVGRIVHDGKFWRNFVFTKIVSGPTPNPQNVHPGADQSLHVVREIGITTADSTPRLSIAQTDRTRALEVLSKCRLTTDSRWISINPCSRWKYKEWGYGKWGEVIDQLWQAHRLSVVLVGSPEESAVCQGIVAGREAYAFNLAGETTLGELAAVMQLSTLHIGVDSAASHIAAAVGTPTMTIFGPSNWKGWTVVDDLHRIVVSAMPCVPCNKKGCDNSGKSRCLDELGVNTVLKTVDELLEKLIGIELN